MKTNKPAEIFVLILAGFCIFCFTATVLLLCFHAVPPENKDMVNIFLGVEGTFSSGVVGYYFGSSKSSADKDVTIANSTLNQPAPPAPPAPVPSQETK